MNSTKIHTTEYDIDRHTPRNMYSRTNEQYHIPNAEHYSNNEGKLHI
jgi:hypothetical protein